MSLMDVLWIIGWFFVGLFTFQVKGIKWFFSTISIIASLLSLFLLLKTANPIAAIANTIGLDFLSGFFTNLIYLIGANISRFNRFGRLSPKIVLYLLYFILGIILKMSFS